MYNGQFISRRHTEDPEHTAGGVPRFSASGFEPGLDGLNPYAATLIAPDAIGSEIPDSNNTLALLKVQAASEIIYAPANGTIGILNLWYNPDRLIRIFVYYVDRWYWWKNLQDPEDLADAFKQFRLISAMLSLQSATITGNNFEVGGSINAVVLNDLPDFCGSTPAKLRFETLSAYGADARSMIVGQPAWKGVVAVSPPGENHEYIVPGGRAVLYTDKLLQFRSACVISEDDPPVADAGWVIPTGSQLPLTDITLFDSTGTNFVPANLWGNVRFAGSVLYRSPTPTTGTVYVTLRITTSAWDELTNLPVDTVTDETVAIGKTSYMQGTIPFEVPFFTEAPIKKVEIIAHSDVEIVYSGGAGLVRPVTDFISFATYELLGRGYRFPATFTAVKGLEANQQLVVGFHKNYSVVPDAETSRNVSVSHKEYRNELDLSSAEEFIANPNSGVKFIYKLAEYEQVKEKVAGLAERENVVAHASGFGKKLWAGLKKTGKALAAPIGAAVGILTKSPQLGALTTGALGRIRYE